MWMARNTMSCCTFAHVYLHAAICGRASRVLELSIVHAVHSTSKRSMLYSAYESAIACWTIW